MVTHRMGRRMLLSAVLLLPTAPVRAEGILEQLQKEIETIAARTRSAVVTIEDVRAAVTDYEVSPLAKQDRTDRLSQLKKERLAAENRLASAEALYKQGSLDATSLDERRTEAAKAAEEEAYAQKGLGDLGRTNSHQGAVRLLLHQIQLAEIEQRFLDNKVERLRLQLKAGAVAHDPFDQAKQAQDRNARNLRTLRRQLSELEPAIQRNSADVTKALTFAKTLFAYSSDGKMISPPRSGTGFSIGNGYIVSTADVLQGMKNPIVVTDSGQKLRAKIVGIDTEQNLGLIKLTSTVTIPALELGDSEQALPGHFIISIGNQTGQTNAIALNLISGTNQRGTWSSDGRHFYPKLIEFGGTVGAGASGAPLVDAGGKVIGILAAVPRQETEGQWFSGFLPWKTPAPFQRELQNSANDTLLDPNAAPQDRSRNSFPDVDPKYNLRVLSPKDRVPPELKVFTGPEASSSAPARYYTAPFPAVTSAGFAIPINGLKPLIADLRAGRSHRPIWIGLQTAQEEHADEVDGILSIRRFVKITGVYQNSPAQHCGIETGDILVTIKGHEIHSTADLHLILLQQREGDKLALVVERNGHKLPLSLTVEARPEALDPVVPAPAP